MVNNKSMSVIDAVDDLAAKFIDRRTLKIGGFWDFVRDYWSKGYENPELFNTWHVGTICEDVERAIQEGKNYVAVLPRYHFKSTVLGHAFSVWRFLSSNRDTDILYLSYSDGMSQYHLSEINKHVRRIPELMDMMEDRSPQADYSFRYMVNNRQANILHGGLFSFKRGLHVNGGLVVDDILRDPENPLNLGQLNKIEDHFMTESMFIPNRGAPIIVIGTPMAPDDLLTKLQNDERFISRVLPVFNPTPDRYILAPEIFTEEELKEHQRARPKSFASEFMLAPYLSTESYFSEEDMKSVENEDLESLDPYKIHDIDSEYTVAGFDIGKKRHPSHLVIYASRQGKMVQIHQSFLDNWNYTRQIQFLNDLIENFDIDKGYVDNTRGELEDRGLNDRWEAVTFTAKNKRKMAQVMEEYIHSKKIEMISNMRQRSQITCVDNELRAPETPLGHGDSFFSNALAILVHSEMMTTSTGLIGDAQDWLEASQGNETKELEEHMGNLLEFKKPDQDPVVCQKCNETGGWIPERGLCLLCYYRDINFQI